MKPSFLTLEACSLPGWGLNLAHQLGIEVVAHPDGEGCQLGRVKRRTDKDDALKLAKLAKKKINSVHVPSPEHR